MKKTVKKSLAILLCALIMLSALPVQALAAEAGDVISDTSVSLQEDATGNDSSQPEAEPPPADSTAPESGTPAPEEATSAAPDSGVSPDSSTMPESGLEPPADSVAPEEDSGAGAPPEADASMPATEAPPVAPEAYVDPGVSPIGQAWVNPANPSIDRDPGFELYCELWGVKTNAVAVVLSTTQGHRVWETTVPLFQEDGFKSVRHFFPFDTFIEWRSGEYCLEVFLDPTNTWHFENYWTVATFYLSAAGDTAVTVQEFSLSSTSYTMGTGDNLTMSGRITTAQPFEGYADIYFHKLDDGQQPPAEGETPTQPEGVQSFGVGVNLAFQELHDSDGPAYEADLWAQTNNPYFDGSGTYCAWLYLVPPGGNQPGQPIQQVYVYLGSIEVQESPAMFKTFCFYKNGYLHDAGANHNAGTIQTWYNYSGRPADITAVAPVFTVSDGAVVTVNGVVQQSGVSTQDFTSPVPYVVTSADGLVSKSYMVTIIVQPAVSYTTLYNFSLTGLPAGSDALVIDNEASLIYTTVPAGTASMVFTPVFEKHHLATANLQSGVAVDFETSPQTPVELTITAEDGVTTRTWHIVVARKGAPAYYGQVFTYSGGQTQTLAGRKVMLHDLNRASPYSDPIATVLTDENGRYEFYTDAIPGVEAMNLAVRPETFDAPGGGEDSGILGEHGIPLPGTSYTPFASVTWVPFLPAGKGTDFHLFAGTYLWKTRVVEAGTGQGIPDAAVRGAYYGFAYVHTTGADGALLEEPVSAYSLREYLRHANSQTVFGAYKAGYRDVENIVVNLDTAMFEQLKTSASFTTPNIEMALASHEAALLSFSIGGHQATINESAKTVTLMLPFMSGINLASVAPQFTVSPLATASPASGRAMNFANSVESPVQITVTAEDTLTSATYAVTVEMEPDIQVDYSGTISTYDGTSKTPADGFTFLVQDTWGKVIQAAVTCSAQGWFSFTITGTQATRGVYIINSQSIGKLLRPDLGGFYTASVLYRLEPGAGNDLAFATVPTGSEIRGRVIDPSGNNVAGADIYYLSPLAQSRADGSFALTIDADWLRYHRSSFTVRKDGYNNAGFSVNMNSAETFTSLLKNGYIDVGALTLSPSTGTPVKLGRVAALPQYTQRGKTVQTYVHYAASRTLQDAVLTVTVPAGVTIEPASITSPAATLSGNTITLASSLAIDTEYTLGFWATADAGYAGDSFAVTARVTAGGSTWQVGESHVSLTHLTLQVPHQVGLDGTDSLPFTISGEATAGPDYSIDIAVTDPDGKPAQTSKALTGLPTTGVGPWFKVQGVVLQNAAKSPGQYTLLATLKDGGGNPVAYSTAILYVVPDAIKLTSINMSSYYFNVSAAQPVTNSSCVSACAYVNNDLSGRDPINLRTTWQNDSDVISAIYVMETSHGTFLSTMSTRAGGVYAGQFAPGAYMGSGTANIYLEFGFEDGSAARFLVGKLLLLIDPSGFVYDKTTGQRIEGATATLEYLVDGGWVMWPADEFGQNNPQTTDNQGCYGWFVPEGEYRVLVSAEGYAPYATNTDAAYGVINVLPPRDDIHIGLTPTAAVLAGLQITAAPAKTQYHAGQLLDLSGLVATALYSDGSRRVLGAAEYTASPANGAALTTPGAVQVTVSHREGDVVKSVQFTVQVAAVVLTGLEVAVPPAKTGYIQGDKLDLAGLSLAARYSDGSSRTLAADEYTAAPAAGALLNTPGDVPLTLRYQEGGTTLTATVTLRAAAPSVVLATGVTLDKLFATLAEGDTLQLAATVQPADADNQALSWASSDPAVAAVDATGLVTALKAGSATITVTTADGGYTALCSITVEPVITGVKLAQTTLRLAKNQKATLGAVVTYSNGTTSTTGLTWASSNEKVATVTEKGVIKARSVKKNSTATITATAENGQQATIKVTVLKSSAKAVKVNKIAVSGSKTVTVGDTAQLKAKVSPGSATGAAISWKSHKPGVVAVDATGKLTAISEGAAKITVKAGAATTTVTVTAVAPVESIKITGAAASLKQGKSLTLSVDVTLDDPSYTATPELAWSSNRKDIATVSSKGVVKARKVGTATITVKAANGKKASVKIKVTK